MATLSTKHIAQAIYESAKNKSGAELESALANVVVFLAKKNLLSKTSEILKHLEHAQDTDQHILRAKILSKTPLSKDITDKLTETLKKKYAVRDVILKPKEDLSLIGGIRIETNDEVIDLSLKNKLNQLQTHLLTH